MTTATDERTLNYLLVEDNDSHADLIERCFDYGDLSCAIRRVKSGSECLAYLAGDGAYGNREMYPSPDIVLLDIRMPGVLDGLHTLHAIRSDSRHRKLVVTMLTTSDRNSDVSRAYELGANGYVVKSSDTEEMIEKLKQMQQSFVSLHQIPNRIDPYLNNPSALTTPTEAPPSDLETFLDASPERAFDMLVAAYQSDPASALRMLKVLELSSTARFETLVARFCLEQRRLFAGGQQVDWTFIHKIVMSKLPHYAGPERMAGIVAGISAAIEQRANLSEEDTDWQAWRGFCHAYLNQRWSHDPNAHEEAEPAQNDSRRVFWMIGLGVGILLATFGLGWLLIGR